MAVASPCVEREQESDERIVYAGSGLEGAWMMTSVLCPTASVTTCVS